MNKKISVVALALVLGACASTTQTQTDRSTVRVCTEAGGCVDQPLAEVRARKFGEPETAVEREQAQRIAALEAKAAEDPRAAFDLGLRFFRGDGVARDTYKSLVWMRKSAERGNVDAQLALGRFYLSGLEEMGADPAEAESWLTAAAGQGNAEAKQLLAQAQQAKRDDEAWRRWVDAHRAYWLGFWWSGYPYYTYWAGHAWYFR